MKVSASGITLDEGSVVAMPLGLHLDFSAGDPISVEIVAGKISAVTIKAWDPS